MRISRFQRRKGQFTLREKHPFLFSRHGIGALCLHCGRMESDPTFHDPHIMRVELGDLIAKERGKSCR